MIFNAIKPQKAKTFGKDKIKDLSGEFAWSIKYDGHQIFIVKIGTDVKMYTSNWKQFDIALVREGLRGLSGDFMLVGEFLYGVEGKLGARALSSKLTTYRTNYKHGIMNDPDDEYYTNIRVFDFVPIIDRALFPNVPFSLRLKKLNDLDLPKGLTAVTFLVDTFDVIVERAKKVTSEGWEGLMAIKADSLYMVGKRVHHAIKIKPRLTADLLCIDVRPGTGKYVGLIGSLICRDSSNRIVNVGSGLSDDQRALTKADYIGKVVEVEYEKIEDTYIQPVFKCIRNDKSKEEID